MAHKKKEPWEHFKDMPKIPPLPTRVIKGIVCVDYRSQWD